MIEIQCDASGDWCQYDETATLAEIGQELRSQGWIGSAAVRRENGEVRGWVRVSDEGDVTWAAQ